MRQYEMIELVFEGEKPEGSYVDIDLKAVFTTIDKVVEVKGFYAGNGQYKVRFFPEHEGEYSWNVTGCISAEGKLVCPKSKRAHGMVQADGIHFRYSDGTQYHPFGTTIYALIHQDAKLVDTTMETLREGIFNKVRFCIFPKSYDYNQNDPPLYAFERSGGKWDVHKPCMEFWDALETRILELQEMGIESDLILFHPYDRWGFAGFSKEECLVYLDYAVRRLAAYPSVWWSLANEYDLMEEFEEDWWEGFAQFIADNDPYGHLLSNHNCISYWDFHNPHVTHCSIQDICVEAVPALQEKYGKPVVFDECCYEGNLMHSWGNLSAFEMVHRFWSVAAAGGYCTHGETYLDEEDIIWWSKGGRLRGESPERIRFLRNLIEQLPGPLSPIKGDGYFSPEVDVKEKEEMLKNPDLDNFTRCILKLSEGELARFMTRIWAPKGHYQEQAYLFYYGRQCAAEVLITLPETYRYRIEVVDVWEMTRETVRLDACGNVKVPLPGKEGMAVLAVRVQEGERDDIRA